MRGYTSLRNVGRADVALYRFEAKIISRSGGKSSLNAAAYRTGKTAVSSAAYRHTCALTDEQTGQTYDYSRKAGVRGSEILAPANAPAWSQDRQELWNQVERAEKRKDSQLARDFVISLPHELNHEQRRAMLGEFLQRHFVADGYLCDVAYHRPHGKGDDRNHHAHVMVPMRRLDEEGFSKRKDRPEGNPTAVWKEELAVLREDWGATVNRHLEAAGRQERVSHLSLEAQGINRVPEPKQGALATQIEREGRESHAGNDRRRVQAGNAEREAIEAEMSSVVSLAVEAMKRGKMKAPNDELTDKQAKREAVLLGQMQEQDERLSAFKKVKEAEAEEAKKHDHANQEKQERSWREGDISDAGTRYSVALGKCYNVKDPYASLAEAAASEGAAFATEQQNLRREASAESDPGKRQEIDLRRRIEACEYMSVTSVRLSGISATIAGREDAPQAVLDRERAASYDELATKFRDERAQLQADRDRRERDTTSNQAADASQQHEGGQKERGDKANEASQSRQGGEKERGDKANEATDAKADRMARYEAKGREVEQQQMEQSKGNSQEYG